MRSFLQTKEWLEFQKEVGHKVWRFDDGKIMASIIKYNLPFGKSYLYIPHGPEINFDNIKGGLKNELANFVKYLKDLAKSENSIFVKIEPYSDVVMELLHVKGMRRSNKQIQPYKTVVIDLTLPEEHLLGKMHTKTRYNIKVAEKHAITIKPSQDVNEFWKLLQKTTKRDRFSSHPKEYYKKLLEFLGDGGEIKTNLMLAYYQDKPIAGAMVLRCGDTGYYLHGASDYQYRAMMAPYALHWDIIKYLKNNGVKYYDFWGIDATKWPGVTRFKLGWGGDSKEYPGSFDLVISRLWYFGYSLARMIFCRKSI
ncbi:MAG: peptidoglycan bridge formation glycyltransferase FemA/FemB family protein [bacterium]|nr:peptidoglycan bridge formation glycyltransferase FemA/FemB family protein [bacterium]